MSCKSMLATCRVVAAVAVICLLPSLIGSTRGADPMVHGSGAGKPQLVTRPIPMTKGVSSPFYITLSETQYDKPALAALSGASKDSPDYVAHGLVSAIAEDNQALFRELTVPEEQGQASQLLAFLRGFGGRTATLVSRVDLGGVSLYLLRTTNGRVPLLSIILKETKDGYRQSFQMTQQPLCATVISLWGAMHNFPQAFEAVSDKKFEYRLSLGPVAGDSKQVGVTISFERGCKTSFLTFDKEAGDALAPPTADCGTDVRDVLQFDRDFWGFVMQKKYDEIVAALDPARAQRLTRLRKLRGDGVLSPRFVFKRREVRYVVASEDAYVLFSWLRLYAPGVQATPLKIQPDIIVRSPADKWQMLHYNSSNAFTELLSYQPLLSQIVKLAAQ